jgi:ATP-binding cassette subfamily D (ALD) protein 3
MAGFTYYKVSNLDNRIANADQLLTQDVEKFCTSVSELYSNVSKPILDIFIYARKLSGAIGAQGIAPRPSLLARCSSKDH